ncbi:uncharacterized protein TNCV_1994321 [Trichonephila clavipes]|nr:uncharacterized protein TNCV_1994321 [Trichonephila clavipes]
MLTSHCSATRGLLATDHVILNHGQVTWTTPELAPPLTTTSHQREDVSALDRFNVHRCPTRRVFSGTGIELMTCLPWLDTLTTGLPQPQVELVKGISKLPDRRYIIKQRQKKNSRPLNKQKLANVMEVETSTASVRTQTSSFGD